LREGRGGKVLIEEADDTLVIENRRGGGEFYGEFGVGGDCEAVGRCGGAREKQLGRSEGGEWLGEREALVEEETYGDKRGARIATGCV